MSHGILNNFEVERLLTLLNEKEVLLKERELALNEQQEEFLAQKEELNAAVEELVAKNTFLTATLARLKTRNDELDQILYRASHDLKTPVSSISGLISMLEKSTLTSEQQSITEHLYRKTRQMDSLLHSLSDLSTAFFRKPRAEMCVMETIVQQAWKNIKNENNVRLSCEVDSGSFSSDSVLMSILLGALLQNAVTFSDPSKENCVRVVALITSSKLVLEVHDSGESIPGELSQRIFDMFFRGSVRSNGPGLGLYIAKTISDRLQGDLVFVSQPEKKFILTLPELQA